MQARSDASAHPFAVGAQVSSYALEGVLGSGGMGTVYAARHVGLDKPVVLKTLHPTLARNGEAVQRFLREGRAAARIRHPHVVDVTDVGAHEGLPYLVMERLQGEDLHARLTLVGRLTPAEIGRVVLPVLDALSHAHAAGVIHRDLKPSNVFLAQSPHGEVPKLLDFGIAKIVATGLEATDPQTITVAASYLGTPYYCSPEQAMNGAGADARSDQYAAGAILYQLATGQHGLPSHVETAFEVLSAIVADKRASLGSLGLVDPGFAAVVDRAMAYAPGERFADVRALGRALLPHAAEDVRARWAPVFAPPDEALGFAETQGELPRVSAPPEVSPSFATPGPAPAGTGPAARPGAPAPSGVRPAARVEPAGPGDASARPSLPAPGDGPPLSVPPPLAAPQTEGSGGRAVPALVAASLGLAVAGLGAGGLYLYANGTGAAPARWDRVGAPSQPATPQPDGTQPDGTRPDGTQPDGTQPDGTQPDGTQPDGTQPARVEPSLSEARAATPDEPAAPTGEASGAAAEPAAPDAPAEDLAEEASGGASPAAEPADEPAPRRRRPWWQR